MREVFFMLVLIVSAFFLSCSAYNEGYGRGLAQAKSDFLANPKEFAKEALSNINVPSYNRAKEISEGK